jgi:hypothetical protein
MLKHIYTTSLFVILLFCLRFCNVGLVQIPLETWKIKQNANANLVGILRSELFRSPRAR